MRVAILNSLVRLDFTEKVIFQQRLEEGEGVGHVGVWGKSIFGRRYNSAKTLRQEFARAV